MSSDVIARLESLLQRVVGRRALPRAAAPLAAPVLATSPAPRAITPEPPRHEAPRLEARRPEAAPVAEAPKPVAEAPKPVAEAPKPVTEAPQPVAEAPQPVAEAPQPVAEAPKPVAEAPQPVAEAPKPVAEAPQPVEPPVEPTLVARRALDPVAAPAKASLPLPAPVKIHRADDRIAASFAAGAAVSPGFGEDEADHVETLAFRVGRALPKPGQVPAPPLPVTTREDSSERRSERFAPALPVAPVAAQVSEPAPKVVPASLRTLLQRSVALRPRG